MKTILNSLNDASELIQLVSKDFELLDRLDQVISLLVSTFQTKKKVLICGNGGSACDAMHFAEEFTGKFNVDRLALPVISLTDPGHITCVGNDYGFEFIFQRGVEAFGLTDDVFIGLSTSGNSKNIITALHEAKSKNLKTILFLGQDGGLLRGLSNIEILVPGKSTDRIQEIHMMLLHIVIQQVEFKLFPELK